MEFGGAWGFLAVTVCSKTGIYFFYELFHGGRQPAVASFEFFSMAVQIQMKFYGICSPPVDGSVKDGRRCAVVGPARRAVKGFAQCLDSCQVALIFRCRITGNAMQQGEVLASGFS
jgi:hypothetical protein